MGTPYIIPTLVTPGKADTHPSTELSRDYQMALITKLVDFRIAGSVEFEIDSPFVLANNR